MVGGDVGVGGGIHYTVATRLWKHIKKATVITIMSGDLRGNVHLGTRVWCLQMLISGTLSAVAKKLGGERESNSSHLGARMEPTFFLFRASFRNQYYVHFHVATLAMRSKNFRAKMSPLRFLELFAIEFRGSGGLSSSSSSSSRLSGAAVAAAAAIGRRT